MSALLKLAAGWPSWMPVCCVVNVLMSCCCCCCSLVCLCSNRQHCCCSMVHQHIRLNLDPCPNLFTWSLPLIIINKYDDLIFIKPIERARKEEGLREGGMEKKNCFSPLVHILSMSVTYSTVTDIKTLVKRCYDVHRSFSNLYLPRTVQVLQQK